MKTPIILIHGGAGAPNIADASAVELYGQGLRAALQAARAALAACDGNNGDNGNNENNENKESGENAAINAAVAAVKYLENDPQFNAGIGSVLDSQGNVACSASVMCGSDGRAGAVAGVTTVRHPIALAADLLNHRHVMMIGEAAERLAHEFGLERLDPQQLVTQVRQQQLQRIQAVDGLALDHDADYVQGTVGAVVRAPDGTLAAATSTGGMTNQLPGRVGDSPIIGAGTWADRRVAISATGAGEAFMRTAFSHRIASLIELAGLDLACACDLALAEVSRHQGSGGCIALTADGHWHMPFTTPAMLRACAIGEQEPLLAIGPDAQVSGGWVDDDGLQSGFSNTVQ